MITINKQKAKLLINESNGEFFNVEFIKKNGDKRSMTCRLGVKKHLKGGELAFDHNERGLLPVFDVQIKEYRMINLKSLKSLTISGQTYKVK